MQHKNGLGHSFWRMWSAVAASSLGDGIFSVALPLLALRYTRDPLAIAGVVIAGQVPVVVAALPIGTLADRLNRRRMLVAVEVARFVLLAAFGSLILLHRDSLVLVYIAALLLGALNIAFDVVANACVPSLVRQNELVRANAHLLNAEMTAENLVGQAVGGAAISVSRFLPFIADAVSRAVSAFLLNGAIPDNEPEEEQPTVWRDLVGGLRWFVGNPVLRLLTAVIASLAFCQGIVLGLLTLYGREQLHLGGGGYGLFLAVGSIGTVLGGMVAPRVHNRFGSGATILLAGLLFGSAYPVLAVTHSPLLASVALFAQESMVIVGSTAARSLRQRIVPEAMQGRAASAHSVVILSCYPLGGLLGGAVAGAAGLSTAFMVAAIVQVAFLALTGPRLLASLRAMRVQTHIRAIRRSLETIPTVNLVDDGALRSFASSEETKSPPLASAQAQPTPGPIGLTG